MVVQSTSPTVAPKSYWCINNTIASTKLHTYPYHAFVPSFGMWGFVLASKKRLNPLAGRDRKLPVRLKYMNGEELFSMFLLAQDLQPKQTQINRLNNQILVHYFEEEWSRYGI